MAASTFNVMEGRVEATKREVKEEQWGLVDFLGKYHKHIIKSENPIPGTAVAADDRRERAWSDRLASIRGRIEDIEERHGANVRGRVSHATFELKAQIQKRVGSTLDRIGGVIDDIDDEVAAIQFEASGQSRRATEAEEAFERERRAKDDRVVVGDGEFEDEGALAGLSDAAKAAEAAANAMEVLGAAADDRKWWGYVRGRDLFGMEKMFKGGYDRIDQPEPVAGAAPGVAVHVATRRGDVDMLRLLLRYGANANTRNALGDTALLSCWAFWRNSHAADRLTQKDDEARDRAADHERTTVALLALLLAHGADANAPRQDRSTALHEAVRRGPVLAVRALLQYGADRDSADVDRETPFSISTDQVKADAASDWVYGAKTAPSPDHPFGLKARFKRRNPDRAEIFQLLKLWPAVAAEQKVDEFYQLWDAWMRRTTADGATAPRDLRETISAARVIENTALDICHKQLATSQKIRAYGTPFWSYDAVRRTLCCGQLRAKDEDALAAMRRRFDDGSLLAPTPNHYGAGDRKVSATRHRGLSIGGAEAQQLKFNKSRHASEHLPLQVPLDRYLLRSASAADAGFTEVRDKVSEEEQERARALERVEERAAAKRREERRLARQRAIARQREVQRSRDGSRPASSAASTGSASWSLSAGGRAAPPGGALAAIYGSGTERRRTAAALACAADGLDERTLRRAATNSCVLHTQRERPPVAAGGAALIAKINEELAELRTYGKLTGAREQAAARNPLEVAKQRKVARKPGAAAKDALEDDVDVGDSGSILLALGDARRRKAANDRRQNEASDLPPQRRAMRFSEDLPPQILPPEARRHKAFPWSMQWPPDEANKVSEVTHNDLSRLYAIINETEEAVNLQQRPLDPALVVHEEVTW